MKDFSIESAEPIDFKIKRPGDSRDAGEDVVDVFHAIGDIPGGTITDLAAVVTAASDVDKLEAVMRFLDEVLEEESADLFASRMRDKKNPITFKQSVGVFEFLVEAYTDDIRPTEAQPSSSSGSGPIEPSSREQRRSTQRSTGRKTA